MIHSLETYTLNYKRIDNFQYYPLDWLSGDKNIQGVSVEVSTDSSFKVNDPKYDPIVFSLLQNVLVVDSLENGNHLSSLLDHNYKIVTLSDVLLGNIYTRGNNIKENTGKYYDTIISHKSTIPDLVIYNKVFNKNECFTEANKNENNYFPRQ